MELARHLGIQLKAGRYLFQVVFDVVSDQFKFDEDSTLEIVMKRLANMSKSMAHSADVLRVDAALDAMDNS